jgi:PAS domain S-box-containing protein
MSAEMPDKNINQTETKSKDLSPELQTTAASTQSGRSARALADLMGTLIPGIRRADKTFPQESPLPETEQQPPELLELLLEGPDAIVIVHRETGLIVEANYNFAQWAGRSREELSNVKFLDLFAEIEHNVARTLFEDAGAGGVHVIELPNAQQPHTRLVEFTSAQSTSGNGEYAILMGRDLGERAATERYLRAERDRFSAFIRAMRDSLILLSPTGDILFANPTAEQMFEPYELPVVCHRWLKEFSQRDKSDLQGLASAYEGQTLELEGNDGRIYMVTRSFLFQSGHATLIMLMAKDITDQRIVEQQNHQLELEVVRESKLAEFGTLSAGIAHNLNGPLMGILGFCEMIDMRSPGQSEIAQIKQQATVMKEIVANLLQKSRNEREAAPQYLVIEDIIRTELAFLEANLFFKHDVAKEITLDPNSPPIFGVYVDFSQVLGNLLRNAIDAMHKSPVRKLTVITKTESRHLIVTVSDTGCGITDEAKGQLFKPFFTTKPKMHEAAPGEPTGTGLGLSTTRKTLARYGAEIRVQSEVGMGTTFTVSIPLDRNSSPAQ